MKVIIGAECSGIIREAFRKLGHEAWSCDLKPAEDGGPHIQGDIFDYLGSCQANNYDAWDLFICHPPCTFNALSSSQWRYHPDDRNLPKVLRRPNPFYPMRKEDQQRAIDFFKKCWLAPIEQICLENPLPLKSLVSQLHAENSALPVWR